MAPRRPGLGRAGLRIAYRGRISDSVSRSDQVAVGLSVLMRLFVSRSASLFGWCVLHRPDVGLLFAVAFSIVLVSGSGKLREAAYGRQAPSGR